MKKKFTYDALVYGCKAFFAHLDVLFFAIVSCLALFIGLLAALVAVPLSIRAIIGAGSVPLFMQFFTVFSIVAILSIAGWLTFALDALYLQLGIEDDGRVATMFSLPIHQIMQAIVAWILYNVIGLLGLLLGVVPGVIWFMRAAFYPWIIIQKDITAIEALKESFYDSRPYNWQLFGLLIATLLLSSIPVVGSIIGNLAYVYVYKKIF